jgi:hypothetical protein
LAVKLRFYLDENVEVVVAAQLRVRGIEAFTARDLDVLGDSDLNHLERATQMNCVLCTYDSDYLRIAAEGIQHMGIVMGQRSKHGIGDWVKTLELLHAIYSADEMVNRVEFV